ncbi:unnamed protein product, partial [Mesorhabditis belari]|uniref:Histone H2A n=1 Tax=Mesorhabditis belari TaxID=2138241 RepID=A0AAF3FFE8_9BILA
MADVGKAGAKRPTRTRSQRAGLVFPVTRVQKALKKKIGRSVSGPAALYGAAIIEYLAAEILDLAASVAKDNKTKRVTPRHLVLAIRSDDELDQLCQGTIAGGGVIPHVHRFLMGNKAPATQTPAITNNNIGFTLS